MKVYLSISNKADKDLVDRLTNYVSSRFPILKWEKHMDESLHDEAIRACAMLLVIPESSEGRLIGVGRGCLNEVAMHKKCHLESGAFVVRGFSPEGELIVSRIFTTLRFENPVSWKDYGVLQTREDESFESAVAHVCREILKKPVK